MAGDFTHTNQIAVGGRDKDFFGGVKILGTKSLLDHGEAGFGSDFEQNPAGDTFQAAGIERRSENLAFLDGENIRGSAFRHFAALVEHDDFVESFLVGFGGGPDIAKPGSALDTRERRSSMAAMLAESQADHFAVLREVRGVDDEVDDGTVFGALPKTDGIVNEIDTSAAFSDLVGANDFVKMDADLGGGVGHGEANEGSVLFEAAPVALVSESFATGDPQGSENAPATNKPDLAGREPDLFDGQQAIVMEDVRVNHWLFLCAKRHKYCN